jgi:hypothetical protein
LVVVEVLVRLLVFLVSSLSFFLLFADCSLCELSLGGGLLFIVC